MAFVVVYGAFHACRIAHEEPCRPAGKYFGASPDTCVAAMSSHTWAQAPSVKMVYMRYVQTPIYRPKLFSVEFPSPTSKVRLLGSICRMRMMSLEPHHRLRGVAALWDSPRTNVMPYDGVSMFCANTSVLT